MIDIQNFAQEWKEIEEKLIKAVRITKGRGDWHLRSFKYIPEKEIFITICFNDEFEGDDRMEFSQSWVTLSDDELDNKLKKELPENDEYLEFLRLKKIYKG